MVKFGLFEKSLAYGRTQRFDRKPDRVFIIIEKLIIITIYYASTQEYTIAFIVRSFTSISFIMI